MCWHIYFLKMHITVNWCYAHLIITQHAVGCTEDTQSIADFSTYPLTMEYAPTPYTMLSPTGACATVQPVLWHRHCTTLFDIIQDTNDSRWSEQHLHEADRVTNSYGTHECRLLTGCTVNSQQRCHNCRCGIITAVKLIQDRKIGNI
jgi:hypothetical protein